MFLAYGRDKIIALLRMAVDIGSRFVRKGSSPVVYLDGVKAPNKSLKDAISLRTAGLSAENR
jgi:hypothetical protein